MDQQIFYKIMNKSCWNKYILCYPEILFVHMHVFIFCGKIDILQNVL